MNWWGGGKKEILSNETRLLEDYAMHEEGLGGYEHPPISEQERDHVFRIRNFCQTLFILIIITLLWF
jgi:hypothetical protein